MNPSREVLEEAWLLIEGGRIAALGAGSQPPPGPPADEQIDCRGRIVLPGLIQSHVHLCQTLFRNLADDLELLDWLKQRIWPFEAAHDAASMRASADLGIAELLRGGTTTVLDMGSVHHYDAVFEAARDAGIRLTGGKAMMDDGDGVPAGLRETTRESIDESLALMTRWHGSTDDRLRYAFCPRFALSCSEALMREVAALRGAEAKDALLHTHASENQTECRLVKQRFGRDNVEALHELGLTGEGAALAHCIWLSERERDILADSSTAVLHCPGSNLKLASGVAPVPELLERGITVGIGADGAPCNNNLDAFQEMRLAALVQKPRLGPRALPARAVVEMATLGGAKALGLASELGSLEPGKRADVTVVNPSRVNSFGEDNVYSRLVYSVVASQVEQVLVDGRQLVRDGHLLSLDEGQVMHQAVTQLGLVRGRL